MRDKKNTGLEIVTKNLIISFIYIYIYIYMKNIKSTTNFNKKNTYKECMYNYDYNTLIKS